MIIEFDPTARGLKVKEKKSVGQRLLKRKQGVYWTKEKLDEIDLSGETETFKTRIVLARWDIIAHGNDALSHLCLEGSSHNALIRDGIKTISALEAYLNHGGVRGQVVLGRLALFHQKLAEQTPAGRSKFDK